MHLFRALAVALVFSLTSPAWAAGTPTPCGAPNPSVPCDMTAELQAQFPGTATPDQTWSLLPGFWRIIGYDQDVDVQAVQGDVYLLSRFNLGTSDGSPDVTMIGTTGQRLALGEHRCIAVHGSLMASSPSGKGQVAVMYSTACTRLMQ